MCRIAFAVTLVVVSTATAQMPPLVENTPVQPLLAQAARLDESLSFLGSALSVADSQTIKTMQQAAHTDELAQDIQRLLDPYCLVYVHINPEGRVKVHRGPADAELIQDGWATYLVKVLNESGTRATLSVESPQSQSSLHRSSGRSRPREGSRRCNRPLSASDG